MLLANHTSRMHVHFWSIVFVFLVHFLFFSYGTKTYKWPVRQAAGHRIEVILFPAERKIAGKKVIKPLIFTSIKAKISPRLLNKSSVIVQPASSLSSDNDIQGVAPPDLQRTDQAAGTTDIVASSIKIAGKIDLELRNGKPVPLDDKMIPRFSRFAQAVEDAFIDRSRYESRSRMELPNGTVYYRFTQGGKTKCFMTGAVNSPAGTGGGGVKITCPSSSQDWGKF